MASYDYRHLANVLAEAVESATDCKLIESNSLGKQLTYPFCTYTFTSPYIAITKDIVEEELFEATISLTWRTESSLDVLNLANKANKYFRSFAGRESLRSKGVVIVSVGATGPRDTLFTLDYERTAGLDLRLRLKDSFIDETIENIDSVIVSNVTLESQEA